MHIFSIDEVNFVLQQDIYAREIIVSVREDGEDSELDRYSTQPVYDHSEEEAVFNVWLQNILDWANRLIKDLLESDDEEVIEDPVLGPGSIEAKIEEAFSKLKLTGDKITVGD